MEWPEQYLYSVLVAALICTVVQLFPITGTAKEITKLICGLSMTVAVLSPLQNQDFSGFANNIFDISSNANSLTEEGEYASRIAMTTIIKEESEAYVHNKAAELGISVSCCIQVSEDALPVPVSVTVAGQITKQIRTQLEAILITDLGIAKENITWIG